MNIDSLLYFYFLIILWLRLYDYQFPLIFKTKAKLGWLNSINQIEKKEAVMIKLSEDSWIEKYVLS